VVGGRVVAAMRRIACPGEFRANLHRGGRVEGLALDATMEATAVRAAQILGLEVAGVDMLEAADGPRVIEVNASPGLEGIEEASGVDVAGEVIAHLERRLRASPLRAPAAVRVTAAAPPAARLR
jgi:ribosomal protein S6--L-glutamate ligase